MASNYDLRKSKRKSHADYDKDYDEEENPPPKKTQRVNGGRRNSVAKKQGPVVGNHKPEQDLIQGTWFLPCCIQSINIFQMYSW